MDTLGTSRLILQPLELGDARQTQELFPHWEIVKYLNAAVPWPYPKDGAHRYFRDVALPAMERGDEWHWTLRLKSAPESLIGAIGLNRGEAINRGFWLGLAWQGQGLMMEAVVATNDYWFDVLGFDVLRAPKAVENMASRRISEKTGMRVVSRTKSEYVAGRLATEIWELRAQDWRRWRDPCAD